MPCRKPVKLPHDFAHPTIELTDALMQEPRKGPGSQDSGANRGRIHLANRRLAAHISEPHGERKAALLAPFSSAPARRLIRASMKDGSTG